MQSSYLRKNHDRSNIKYTIPPDIMNHLTKCTESKQNQVTLLYQYGLQIVRNKIPEDEFLYILNIFASGFINHKYPYQIRQELFLPEYLNYDWEYYFISERNLCGMAAVVYSLDEGDYVLGNSHNNCCEHCKKIIDGKLFRVVFSEHRREDFNNSIWPEKIWEITNSKYHNEDPCRYVFTKFMRNVSWLDSSGRVQFVTNDQDEIIRSKWEQTQVKKGVFADREYST